MSWLTEGGRPWRPERKVHFAGEAIFEKLQNSVHDENVNFLKTMVFGFGATDAAHSKSSVSASLKNL